MTTAQKRKVNDLYDLGYYEAPAPATDGCVHLIGPEDPDGVEEERVTLYVKVDAAGQVIDED